ncbi:Brp/Blh family beta-carotene 15,15'-dioxygenase [Larsenimonas rhizosphaerae]|uniref:Brp/Blh family beta-carotene 15,15'-dioxygenase n=1 Tax=Larsenimonas rhizosphaerae TaxID=2944682 RepID=UPI002034A385|nr:Brp/Blh family beta-carotene 15,15'-dioxygenase [Larsenimonas rhizosphaerae]MCM2131403.1 Brp/Blh family beta-carotene 15,15'-dioxygenase [Larsenimonas rhizosphaerae]
MNASDMDARRTFYRFALGAALLLATHLTGASSGMGMTVLVVGVAVLGLPHGAFDHLLGQRILRGGLLKQYCRRPLPALLLFLLLYISLSMTLMAGWIAAPALGLWLFLLISACHFGTDWRGALPMAPRLAWGALVIATPFHARPEAVSGIIQALAIDDPAPFLQVAPWVFWGALALMLMALPRLLKQRAVLASLVLLLGAGWLFNPLLYFACYFCACHSPIHLREIRRELGIRSARQALWMAGPVVIVTWIAASIGYAIMAHYSVASPLLKMTFIGLACLTVPHIIVEWLDHRIGVPEPH